MRIENNVSTRPTYTANVAKTKVLTDAMGYMEKYSDAKGDWYNTAQDLKLTKKIIKAFKKHPSPETVMIGETFRYGELFNARGVISLSKATLIDTEPARSDSIAHVMNIMRRIIDPENKKSFNKLMGEEYSKDYQPWWDKNIKPIWADVSERFRENTFFEGNHDKQFNRDFNAQSGEKTNVTKTLIEGMFAHYNKKPPVEETTQELGKSVRTSQEVQPDKYQKIGDGIANFLRKVFG